MKFYYAALSTVTVMWHRKRCGGSTIVSGGGGDAVERREILLWSDRSTSAGTELGAYRKRINRLAVVPRNLKGTTRCVIWGTAVAQWLRCCATNQKVAGSISAGVSGFFIDIKSFRSHYGPGVDSASNINEYREYFLGVKAAGA